MAPVSKYKMIVFYILYSYRNIINSQDISVFFTFFTTR
jgi:hypothetical protein